jgi:hypothetical protein
VGSRSGAQVIARGGEGGGAQSIAGAQSVGSVGWIQVIDTSPITLCDE